MVEVACSASESAQCARFCTCLVRFTSMLIAGAQIATLQQLLEQAEEEIITAKDEVQCYAGAQDYTSYLKWLAELRFGFLVCVGLHCCRSACAEASSWL